MSDESSSPGTWAMDRLLRDLRTERPAAPPGFEILGEIGRGGMGVVHRAREVALDRVVALKVLIAGEDAPDELLERFEREARAAAKLSHPNIVEVLSTGREGARRWIAMRLVEGAPLSRSGRLPVRQALEITRKLALALDHAHSRGVLHRDVKPANVLIDAHGEPQLADFGLARDVSLGSLTVSGERLGTPAYASPEQISGDHARVDARSDVYSLGATLYAMLTGRAPFEGNSAAHVAEAVVRDRPTPPCAAVPDLPREAEAICLRAMEKDPAARYPSARGMAEEIERFLAGGTVPRRRSVSWRWGLVAVVAIGLVAFGLWRGATAGRVLDPPTHGREPVASSVISQDGVPSGAHLRLVSAVLSRWARLREDHGRLDATARDWRLAESDRERELERLWAPFETFRAETPAEPVSQAAMRGLVGWALVTRGRRDAGLDEMMAATATSRDVPIGRLMAALLFFSEYVEGLPMPSVEIGPKGVEFEAIPEESEAGAAMRERMEDLLRDARTAPLWGIEGSKDFAAAIEGLKALHRGELVETDKALSDAMDSPDLRPFETGLMLARGRVRYLAMRFEEALVDLHAVQAARPGEPDAFFDAAECALAAATARIWRGEDPLPLLEEAIAGYTSVAKLDPSLLEAFERRAYARRLRGEARTARGETTLEDFHEAERDLLQAVARGLDAEALHLEMGSLFVSLGHLEAMQGGDFRGSYAKAIAAYDRLIARDEDAHRAWLGRGAARADLGKALFQRKMPEAAEQFEGAVADLGKALALRPKDVLALTNRGAAWIGLGSSKRERATEAYRSAIADFDAVLGIDPEYTSAYNNRAGAYGMLGNAQKEAGQEPWESYDRALADFGEVLKRNPGAAAHWNNRAMLWNVIGEARAGQGQDPAEAYAKALGGFSEAVDRNPQPWPPPPRRGQVHEKLGDHAAAADDYQAAYDVVGDAYPSLPDMIRRERAAEEPRR